MKCKCYHAEKNFLGKIGVCWGTKECEACSCGGDEAKCDFYDYVRKRAKEPTTNADRIRAMTDEELAEKIVQCRDADIFRNTVIGARMNTVEEWLDWLMQEVQK